MITIQLESGVLDTYIDTEVAFEWTAFRFQHEIRDAYTNDITIPKTKNNIAVLGAVGLLDSATQLFGDDSTNAMLYYSPDVIMYVKLQVVAVRSDEIDICLYEDAFPSVFKEKKLNDYFEDDPSTIFAWNINTLNAYPNDFKEYYYGMHYDPKYAQYHPVKRMNDILGSLSNITNYSFPQVSQNWWLMPTLKKVCPQNQIQVIEGFNSSEDKIVLSGGQHITNNMEISYGDGMEEIEFNRAATVNMQIHVAWWCKAAANQGYLRLLHKSGNTTNTHTFQIRGDLYRNHIDTFHCNLQVNGGDSILFLFPQYDKYEMVRLLIDCNISDYTIEDDEDPDELQYIPRAPRLIYYDYNSNRILEAFFDGSSYRYSYKDRSHSGSSVAMFYTTFRSLSYFGYWANMPELPICDMMYSFQWMMGQRLNFDNNRTLAWKDVCNSNEITGLITEIRPHSEKFGQNNYIAYGYGDSNLISTIDNKWLEEEVDLHESCFAKIKNISNYVGELTQYTNPHKESDSEEYECDFEEIDAPALWWHRIEPQGGVTPVHNYIRDIPIHEFELDQFTQIMEVDIDSDDTRVKDSDIIYLDGRKFYVVEGTINQENGRSNLTAILYK